jgi:ornithine cyclodeaminase/alanine dehydrogenase-like protein (mu-crystallin family)
MEGGKILFLNRKEIESVLTWKDIVETCDAVFQWIGEGKVEQHHIRPLRYATEATQRAFALPFPAYVKPLKVIGNKWGGGSMINRKRGLPFATGEITINDPDTLMPLAIMDGTGITALRTGGHAAIGAKYLARKDSENIAIIGCGMEGETHLFSLNELFKIKRVKAFDIQPERAREYTETMGKRLNIGTKICDTAKEAVKGADIICMCTNAMETVVMEDWIESGSHVAATWGFVDLDQKFSKTSDKWVLGNWERDLDWIEVPPFAWMSKLSREDVYADLSEIATGKKPGREKATERTVMSHMGMGALDVAVAFRAYKLALEKGLGITLQLF